MKTWNQLYIRHGWLLESKKENEFVCVDETIENVNFLLGCLDHAKVKYNYDGEKLVLYSKPMKEENWVDCLSYKHRGRGEGLWFCSQEEAPKIRELDTYISGIVRQLNRLGFYTQGSCDGHNRRVPHVLVNNDCNIDKLIEMLLALGMKRVNCRKGSRNTHFSLPFQREELLDIAEKMSTIEQDWVQKGHDYIQEQFFYQLLEQLLSIPGASGNEGLVRQFVMDKLRPCVDHITVDRYGNLLAEKTYRTGNGPTILLNAHLDTVDTIDPNRTILKDGDIWSSSSGILGADDRAGVALLIHIANVLHASQTFHGKVKFIFTVEEEIGLMGASQVDSYFLWGTDAAIVLDRRGTHDIVVSCGGYFSFCDEQYGRFFEEMALEGNLGDWTCTAGGSSDTRIWAEHGIQSVNLSVGYANEHTDREYLDVAACYNTAKLVKSVFKYSTDLKRVLRNIQISNRIAQ